MPDLDRVKVIKGLYEAAEVIENHVPARYIGYARQACRDAINLLKEQEEVKPEIQQETNREEGSFARWWSCGACHQPVNFKDPYCWYCGKKVKWDDA